MNWDDFFARTLEKSGLSSYAQLAPKLGISDGAISHYRTGKRVPQVWVVAEALKVQGHPQPEKAAIEIMKAAALTSPERTFWRRLAATATLLAVGVLGVAQQPAQAATAGVEREAVHIMRNHGWATDRPPGYSRPASHIGLQSASAVQLDTRPGIPTVLACLATASAASTKDHWRRRLARFPSSPCAVPRLCTNSGNTSASGFVSGRM